MRIVLDLQGAQSVSRFRGIGRYSLSLAQAIAREARHHEIWICLSAAFPDTVPAIRAAFADLLPPERVVTFGYPLPAVGVEPTNAWRTTAGELLREAFLNDLQPDLVYVVSHFEGWMDDCVTSIGRLPCNHRTAATLYDLIPLLNPDAYLTGNWIRQWYMGKVESLRRADLLLAISEYAGLEGRQALGDAAPRIVNISSAASSLFKPSPLTADGLAGLKQRHGIRRPYLMYNGALEWRKNIHRLLEAFAELPSSLGQGFDLVLVGKHSDEERESLLQRAAELAITDRLVLTGYVSDTDLVGLYTHCELFVFPSLHEGFGLPALEAMACGAPTIGSNLTSLPEVIGRADAMFDPRSVADMAGKITHVLSDAGFRRQLQEHAPLQARRFSWEASARTALTAFEETVLQARAPTQWPAFAAARSAQRGLLIERLAQGLAEPRPTDTDLRQTAQAIADNEREAERWLRGAALPEQLTWRIEGPFDSSYSLALLNRETATALAQLGHDVALHSTEGPGDFAPSADFLQANPALAAMHKRAADSDAAHAHVCSRNLYPPRVWDMQSPLNLLHHYAWEESGFPWEWVEQFNDHLQGLTALSTHVEKVLIDSGVTVPMVISGCGVDHWERIEAASDFTVGGKSFRFLHVSSCFPRKGADALLRAYGSAFSAADDVTLIIKTFANPHNEIHQWLAAAKAGRSDFPHVEIIERDLSEAELKALYEQCHALVAPSRAEGFGLPLAEAMLSGLPVITTGWGGQLDFCDDTTAWLVDYRFARAETHFGLFDSVWAEPDVEHLASLMREVRTLPESSRRQRVEAGRERLLSRFTWREVATRLVDAARAYRAELAGPAASVPRIGWITTWNTKCGIAAYSAHLVKPIDLPLVVLAPEASADELTQADSAQVKRCWVAGRDDRLERLAAAIDEAALDVVVVQFNYNFFGFGHLDRFIRDQLEAGRKVVVELHSTTDQPGVEDKQLRLLVPALAACQRILVHSPNDMNRLKALGLVANVALFPLGILDYAPGRRRAADGPEVIAAYGFLLPHKGLPELLEAFAQLRSQGRDVELHLINAEYPVPVSAQLRCQLEDRAHQLGVAPFVRLTTDYLSDEESLARLAGADVVVFPYQHTGESASAAVRHGLASGRPVAVTPLAIFDDVAPAVFRLPGTAPAELAAGLAELLDRLRAGGEAIDTYRSEAARWREAHRYSRMGRRLANLMTALHRQRSAPDDAASAPGQQPVAAVDRPAHPLGTTVG